MKCAAYYFVLFEIGDRFFYIVANKIDLMLSLFISRMKSQFRRRHFEDQPAITDVDMFEAQHITEKSAVCFGVFGINNGVKSGDHCFWRMIEECIIPECVRIKQV